MLLQPRLLQLDTLQDVEELQLLRSNVTEIDIVVGLDVCRLIPLGANAICTPAMSNVLPTKSATTDAITTTNIGVTVICTSLFLVHYAISVIRVHGL